MRRSPQRPHKILKRIDAAGFTGIDAHNDAWKMQYTTGNVQEAAIDMLKLEGTPLVLQFKTGENLYAGKRNILTERQERKRLRLKKFIKKKERK